MACVQMHDVAGHVCRSRILLGKCAEAGYCWESVHMQDITGQECRSRVLLGK